MEFLLPSEKAAFLNGRVLPTTPGKCLICSRYYHTYLYRLAISDPNFNASTGISIQAYGNVLCNDAQGDDVPSHSSVVFDTDGYSQEAMLFVDHVWAETPAARGAMGTLLWRPVVRFCANHYKYVKDDDTGKPRIIQVGIGSNQMNEESLFCAPTQDVVIPGLA
jgi:hypothetical protein